MFVLALDFYIHQELYEPTKNLKRILFWDGESKC
jgi:hypothetical protein